jgi:RimJ/RimL family protein N-acetyltransferase
VAPERGEVTVPDVYPVACDGVRIRLREVGPEDAAAAFRWASDPEFFRHLAVPPTETEAEEEAFLRDIEEQAKQRPRRQYHLGAVWKASDELVGLVRLGVKAPEHGEADIGYGLRRDRWREGIATEAAALLVDFGFKELGLHRIYAYHHPGNTASGRVMQKLGMRREGMLRENIFDGTTWRDSVVYAILAHEWHPSPSTHERAL